MFKYWLKHRAPLSALLSIVMTAFLLFGFVSPFLNTHAENRTRLSVYENSKIDYDIPQPTKEQLKEISDMPFVTSVFGYYYTESLLEVAGKSVLTKILFSEDLDALEYTMYTSARMIEESAIPYDNPAYVDYAFAKENGVKLGDILKLNNIEFQIGRIYETNSYYTSAIFIPLVGEQKEFIESNSTSYSGAFLSVNDISQAEKYLNDYKPMGRLKNRSQFQSDVEYELHHEQWEKNSYANEITYFATRKNEISIKSSLPVWVGSAIVLVIILFFNIMAFQSKMEKGYFKAKKTKTGNIAFFLWTAIEELLIMVAMSVVTAIYIINKIPYYDPANLYMEAGITVAATILASVILGYIINSIMLKTIDDSHNRKQ